MNDVTVDVEGFWFAGEAADALEKLLGFQPEVSTVEGLVTIHPRPRALTVDQAKAVRAFLETRPQKSAEARWEARNVAEVKRRDAVLRRIEKLRKPDHSLDLVDVLDILRAMAELLDVDVSDSHGGKNWI